MLRLKAAKARILYSSVAEDENHVRLVTALKSGRLSGKRGLGMRIGSERPVANDPEAEVEFSDGVDRKSKPIQYSAEDFGRRARNSDWRKTGGGCRHAP